MHVDANGKNIFNFDNHVFDLNCSHHIKVRQSYSSASCCFQNWKQNFCLHLSFLCRIFRYLILTRIQLTLYVHVLQYTNVSMNR